MHPHEVRSPEQALVYLADCTLATVSSMALLKSRKKSEFKRQIEIAQKAVDWIRDMKIDPAGTRTEEVLSTTGMGIILLILIHISWSQRIL